MDRLGLFRNSDVKKKIPNAIALRGARCQSGKSKVPQVVRAFSQFRYPCEMAIYQRRNPQFSPPGRGIGRIGTVREIGQMTGCRLRQLPRAAAARNVSLIDFEQARAGPTTELTKRA